MIQPLIPNGFREILQNNFRVAGVKVFLIDIELYLNRDPSIMASTFKIYKKIVRKYLHALLGFIAEV